MNITTRTNISISKEVHGEMLAHLKNEDRKIYRFIEIAIREKIERETKKKKNGDQATAG